MYSYPDEKSIRIGTLVNGGASSADYIRQILPHGFESFGLTFWRTLGDTDLPRLADQCLAALKGSGAVISSLAMFGNPLGALVTDEDARKGWEAIIDAAPLFGADVVAGFTGRPRGASIPDSMVRYVEVWGPLAERAAKKGVRIAFENCPMGGDWNTGDWNIAHNPSAWELMFEALPAENIGLEWEPCHQMLQLIDPIAQISDWASKFFHLHGKCATIKWDVIQRWGIVSDKKWAYHRTPGFGDLDWRKVISELRLKGWTGAIDIEGWHDPVYREELEMTGQVHGLNYLKGCRGGAFVANPE